MSRSTIEMPIKSVTDVYTDPATRFRKSPHTLNVREKHVVEIHRFSSLGNACRLRDGLVKAGYILLPR